MENNKHINTSATHGFSRGQEAAPLPHLLLGSAMWGWNTPKETVFNLLDEWYAQGFRQVDAATNYPINKNPSDFRLSEKILLEWIKTHGISDLQVMMKIGSVNNLFTPEHILTKSFILMMLDEYQHLFENNLHTIMVHWDNREKEEEINETLEAFLIAKNKGLNIGLSGIKHPNIYFELNKKYNFDFSIQIKHNVIHSDYQRYVPFHGKRRFITYGINAGGLKLNADKYSEKSTLKTRGGDIENEPPILQKIKKAISIFNKENSPPPITGFFQIGMINAYYHPDIQGILIGASKMEQLNENIRFYRLLQEVDYSHLFNHLTI